MTLDNSTELSLRRDFDLVLPVGQPPLSAPLGGISGDRRERFSRLSL